MSKVFVFRNNKQQERFYSYLLFVGLSVLSSSSAFAGADHSNAGGFSELIPFWINFLIYCAALYFILRKRIAAGVKARSLQIEEQVNRGARQLELAQKSLELAQAKLSTARAESLRIQEEIKVDGQKEAAQILRDAHERAARIKAQAEELAAAERKATENAIKRELSEIVIKKVTERISRELNAENDRGRRAAALHSVSALVER